MTPRELRRAEVMWARAFGAAPPERPKPKRKPASNSRHRWNGLSVMEMRVIQALVAAQGKPMTRAALLEAVYSGPKPSESVISVFIHRIRQHRPDIGRRIITVPGEGFRLEPRGGA